MRMGDFVRILDRFPRANSISLAGGEPLFHPQLFEMIRAAHQRRMKVHIPSNGTLLPDLVNPFLDAPVEMLNLSFYGTDADSFHEITGADSVFFDRLVSGASSLAARRRPGGFPRILRGSFICHTQNLSQWIPFVRLCEEIGFDHVKLRNLRPWGIPGFEDNTCLYEGDPEVVAFLNEIRRQKFRIPVFLPRLYRRNYEGRPCDLAHRMLTVDGAGFVAPCCNMMTGPQWGNLFRDAHAWNSPAMIGMRRALCDPRQPLPAQCLHCEEMVPDRLRVGG
jgi:MoaA/NifB/PqqE/SkfB family radical SAM enzyme